MSGYDVGEPGEVALRVMDGCLVAAECAVCRFEREDRLAGILSHGHQGYVVFELGQAVLVILDLRCCATLLAENVGAKRLWYSSRPLLICGDGLTKLYAVLLKYVADGFHLAGREVDLRVRVACQAIMPLDLPVSKHGGLVLLPGSGTVGFWVGKRAGG